MLRLRSFLACLLSAATFASVSPVLAHAEPGDAAMSTANRPKVKLDRLSLPRDWTGSKALEAHLRRTLRREAQRADWGSGAGSKISYRFFVERLELREEGGVLHVTCTALGRLPKGKSAKSHIVFGGDPRERTQVVEKVLDIVARGW